ncbi:MAG: DUF4157 domain-containing protein [Deltaproteobacteria bacterium]|nr:DUF4157 domain-containing protein [Deltaproteobacteria bacterium]
MSNRDEDKELLDRGFETLADDAQQKELEERKRIFAEMAKKIEQPGLQDNILDRYESFGKTLLADALPSKVDARLARSLRKYLGKDVSDVRVHSGKVATEAARAMDARAFAIGDKDIFVDQAEFNPSSAQGRALLAHELAHTTDASTGFALSSRTGNSTSAREAFAHDVENKFAREDVEKADDDSVRHEMEPSSNRGPDGTPKEPKVDKVLLAQKIMQVLEKQENGYAMRHGQWSRP